MRKNVSIYSFDLRTLWIEKDKNFDEGDDEDNDIMSHLNYRKL